MLATRQTRRRKIGLAVVDQAWWVCDDSQVRRGMVVVDVLQICRNSMFVARSDEVSSETLERKRNQRIYFTTTSYRQPTQHINLPFMSWFYSTASRRKHRARFFSWLGC